MVRTDVLCDTNSVERQEEWFSGSALDYRTEGSWIGCRCFQACYTERGELPSLCNSMLNESQDLSFQQGRRKHLKLEGGGTTLRGHFLLKKKGAFFKNEMGISLFIVVLEARAPSALPRFLRLLFPV